MVSRCLLVASFSKANSTSKQLQEPTILIGHSLGGAIVEVTCHLRRFIEMSTPKCAGDCWCLSVSSRRQCSICLWTPLSMEPTFLDSPGWHVNKAHGIAFPLSLWTARILMSHVKSAAQLRLWLVCVCMCVGFVCRGAPEKVN